MSTQNHNGTPGAGYMARIAQLAPAARAVKQLHVVRSKRHSIEDARKAVADKLLANLTYLRDPSTCERPDLVYKEHEPGVYTLGIKYGNRWLNGWYKGGNYADGLSAEVLAELLEGFAQDALAGQFDTFIRPIMEANIAARNSVKH